MPILNDIPQDPNQASYWSPDTPFATYPAAAHAMLHPGRVSESRWSVEDYMRHLQGRNNPYYLMQKYWPAGASQVQALQGMGADDNSGVLALVAALTLGVVAVGVAASGAAGYYAGKAIAPSDAQASTYGKIGIAVALLGAFLPDPVSTSAAVGGMAAATHYMSNRELSWTRTTTTVDPSSRALLVTVVSATRLPTMPRRTLALSSPWSHLPSRCRRRLPRRLSLSPLSPSSRARTTSSWSRSPRCSRWVVELPSDTTPRPARPRGRSGPGWAQQPVTSASSGSSPSGGGLRGKRGGYVRRTLR